MLGDFFTEQRGAAAVIARSPLLRRETRPVPVPLSCRTTLAHVKARWHLLLVSGVATGRTEVTWILPRGTSNATRGEGRQQHHSVCRDRDAQWEGQSGDATSQSLTFVQRLQQVWQRRQVSSAQLLIGVVVGGAVAAGGTLVAVMIVLSGLS